MLSWAGMRGVVTLAAALALPIDFPWRDQILLASFGVILVTVLLQGTTIGPLARRLGLSAIAEPEESLSVDAARAHILGTSVEWIETLPPARAESRALLLDIYRAHADAAVRLVSEAGAFRLDDGHLDTAIGAIERSRRELLSLHRSGRIHDSVLHALETEFDFEEMHLRTLRSAAAVLH